MTAFDPVTTTTPTQEPTPVAQQASAFEALVGEGKKFGDTEALAKGKLDSDAFIAKLQSEQAELRAELDKRMTSEEVLAKIQEANSANQTMGENTTPQLSEDKVAELVKSTLESTRTEESKGSNLRSVDAKLVEMYGEKAGAMLHQKAQELGISVDFLQSVAETSPNAFFNTIGVQAPVKSPTVNTGTVNTEALVNVNASSTISAESKAYYDQMRKENPKEYWKPDVQNKIMKLTVEGKYL